VAFNKSEMSVHDSLGMHIMDATVVNSIVTE